jgi:ribosomal protein S14
LCLGDESDRGAEKCRRSGSKEGQFRSLGFS